ncbi:MAG: hypothetical protein ABI665_04815 [Vicinamibacterales bacterium]
MRATVGLAVPADDQEIRGLLRRQPIPGRVSIAFEREPSFATGCEVTGEDPLVLVARAEAGQVVGVACRSVRNVFINGRPERLGYWGQLRIEEGFRGRWLVARGFSLLADIDRADPVPAYLASIVDGSDEAAGILVRRRRSSFPLFRQVARYHTLALSIRRRTRPLSSGPSIMAGSYDQLPEIVAFLRHEGARRQLFPVWTVEALGRLAPLGLRPEDLRIARRGGHIVGVVGLWDQSAYKQAVVRNYSGWLKAASWLGRSIVPRVGDHLRSTYAALIAVADDDAGVFAGLLAEVHALAGDRGFRYLLVGLDERDPLLGAARAYRHVAYPSRLYLASWAHGRHLHEHLDDRPAYVDIATL